MLGNKYTVRLARLLETCKVASQSFEWHERTLDIKYNKGWETNQRKKWRKGICGFLCFQLYLPVHLYIYVSIYHLPIEINCDFLEEGRMAPLSQNRSLGLVRMCRCRLFLESSEDGTLTNWSEMADRPGAGQNAAPSCSQGKAAWISHRLRKWQL